MALKGTPTGDRDTAAAHVTHINEYLVADLYRWRVSGSVLQTTNSITTNI